MKKSDFNIYGFARPTTRAEYKALLDEALLMADQLDRTIDEMGALLEKQVSKQQVESC